MNSVQKGLAVSMVFLGIVLFACHNGKDGESEALYISAVGKYSQNELQEARGRK
jgi:hypothetical protein